MRLRSLGLALAAGLLASCGGGDPAGPGHAALKAAVSTFTGHGVYWNPAEPGTGFFFEAQGATAVITFYAFEADGRPVWYSAAGTFADGGGARTTFSGTLQRFAGGQSASSPTPKTPTATAVGSVSVVFEDERAQVQLPGRAFTAEKFFKAGAGSGRAATQPETGIYWNPAESGRGYTIEVANGAAVVGVFHYADDGQPTWNLIAIPLTPGTAPASGDFVTYAGGQTLTGSFRPVASANVNGRFGISFAAACSGTVNFPGMPATSVRRFAFGSLAAGAECRSAPPAVFLPPLY